MDRSRFARIESLFHAVLEHPPEQWRDFLTTQEHDAQVVAEVERLLAQHTAGADFLKNALDAAAALAVPLQAWIGGYRVLGELGAGGMGTVLLAERLLGDTPQRVALKLIRGVPTAASRERLARERALLAELNHPNIARLIDAGETAERIPYLAMEYVDGVPLAVYCDRHALDLSARLRLFVPLCRAVQHAHQNLVVHRDIKPGNILVREDGTPVLLDFGIGKLIDPLAGDDTATQAFTPAYAAPEQRAGGRATTVTDVYGLGCVLYELASGRSLREVHVDQRLPPPSEVAVDPVLARALHGDVDMIAAKAMYADPAQRYASAGALADDIERYLGGRPVLAHAPSRGYRLRKFVLRHRAAVALATGLTFAALAALGVALWQAGIAREQARTARAMAERTRAVKNLLVGIFDNENPSRPREKMPDTAQLLERGAQRARSELAATPDVESEMLTALGKVYNGLRQQSLSTPLLDEAVSAARRVQPADPALLGAALSERGQTDLFLARYPAALASFDEAIRLQRQADPNGLDLALTLNRRALAYSETGKHADAIADDQDALNIQRQHLPEAEALVLDTTERIGMVYERSGDTAKAEPILREAAEAARIRYGEDHATTARFRRNYATVLCDMRRYAEAAPLLEQVLRVERTIYAPGGTSLAPVLNNLGLADLALGRLHAARALFEEARESNAKSGQDVSFGQAIVLANLSLLEQALGDNVRALALMRDAEGISVSVLGADHGNSIFRTLSRMRLEFELNHDSAQKLLDFSEQVLAHPEKIGQIREQILMEAHRSRGLALVALGQDQAAGEAFRRAVESIQVGKGEPPLRAALDLARWQRAHNATAEAESLLRDFLIRIDQSMPATHWARGAVRVELAELLVTAGRSEAAEAILAGIDETFVELPPEHSLRQRESALRRVIEARKAARSTGA